MTNTGTAAATIEALLNAEAFAITAVANAAYALPEVKTAREAHLTGIRIELAAAGLRR